MLSRFTIAYTSEMWMKIAMDLRCKKTQKVHRNIHDETAALVEHFDCCLKK